MKKCILFFLSVILFVSHTFAQKSEGFELGVGLGWNSSTVESTLTSENRNSFNLGASGEYYFSDRWGLKTKLIYDNKGWADGFIFDEDRGTTTITDFELTYLTVPVMANWHFNKAIRWYLHFGFYVGFLLNAEDSALGLDLKDVFSGTDVGLAFGIGHKFPIADNANLFIEYDGQSGFTDIFEVSEEGTADVTNTRASINFGVLFDLKYVVNRNYRGISEV